MYVWKCHILAVEVQTRMPQDTEANIDGIDLDQEIDPVDTSRAGSHPGFFYFSEYVMWTESVNVWSLIVTE